MAEKHNSPLALAPVGHLYALEVLKLTAVVNGDALKKFIEQFTKAPLQAIDGLDHAGRRVVLHQQDNPHAGPPLCQHQEGLLGALAPHNAVHLPVPKTAPALDLLRALFDALATGSPGGLLFTLGGVVAAALVMQVLRGQEKEHVPTVDVIIDRILTDFRVKFLPVVSDFRKGGTRGKALDHDELLQPLDQGVVMADFELLALFLEESLVFAVCHVRTIDLNVNEVRGALDAQAPAYFIVDRPFTLAQGLRNSGL